MARMMLARSPAPEILETARSSGLRAATAERPTADDRLVPVARSGWLAVVLFFGVLGGWAATAPLGSAVVAPGYFKVESNRRTIQHPDGGLVAELNVKEGDKVQADTLLFRLDASDVVAELGVLEQRHLALRLQEVRLTAEIAGADRLTFPEDLNRRRSDPLTEALWQAELQQFTARRESLDGQREVIGEKIAQFLSDKQGSEEQLQGRRSQLQSMQTERESLMPLLEKGIVTRQRIMQLDRSIAQVQGEIGELTNTAARAMQSVLEQRRMVTQLGNQRIAEAARDLREVQAAIVETVPKLIAARARLQRTEIRARTAGRVVGLTIFSAGTVVGRGEKIMDILPDREDLVVEAHIPVEQITDVRLGMAADVHLTALKDQATPVVPGTVAHVSADRLVEERSGKPYFAVSVQLDAQALAQRPELAFHPGMPAMLMLPTRERTALRYLVDPLLLAVTGAFREK